MFIEKLSTDKMKRKYMKLFFLMNKDSSGEINSQELYQNFQEQGFKNVSKDLVDEIFTYVDYDGEGSVDYNEFIVACLNSEVLKRDASITSMFTFFGPDKD